MMEPHPSDELLIDFVHGRLRQRQSDPIEVHVMSCEDCAARLLELESTNPRDSLMEQIRNAAVPAPAGATPPGRKVWPESLIDHPRFRIRTLLGRGEDESVYLAHHRVDSRRLAVKLVPGDSHAFERIAQMSELLKSHAIPQVNPPLIIEQFGEQLLIAEDYRPGATLREVVCTRGRFTVSEVLPRAQQIAEALTRVHALGQSHGDLQLKDCIVTESDIVIRGWERRRCRETVMHDPRGDTVGLGRCLLALLTGHSSLDSTDPLPFGDLWADILPSVTEVIRSITQAEFENPREAIDAFQKAASPSRWWPRWFIL